MVAARSQHGSNAVGSCLLGSATLDRKAPLNAWGARLDRFGAASIWSPHPVSRNFKRQLQAAKPGLRAVDGHEADAPAAA
jgi:hypothetical protein